MESRLQAACIREARRRGVLSFKMATPGRPGFPDVGLYFPGGHHVLVELKTPTGVLRKKQAWTINKLREQGVEVHVIKNFETFIELLEFYGRTEPGS